MKNENKTLLKNLEEMKAAKAIVDEKLIEGEKQNQELLVKNFLNAPLFLFFQIEQQ